jgi:hypothetical protein
MQASNDDITLFLSRRHCAGGHCGGRHVISKYRLSANLNCDKSASDDPDQNAPDNQRRLNQPKLTQDVFKIQRPYVAGTSSGSIMKSSTVRKQNSFYRSTGIFP